jgi:hypothetical protein
MGSSLAYTSALVLITTLNAFVALGLPVESNFLMWSHWLLWVVGL